MVRRTKGRKGGVEALRNDSGVSVTSTKGVLLSHYQRLGSCSVDDAFDNNWKQEVDSVLCMHTILLLYDHVRGIMRCCVSTYESKGDALRETSI